jgi:hyperosmotically inducible periplasmic protein
MTRRITILIATVLFWVGPASQTPMLAETQKQDQKSTGNIAGSIADEVRHQLVMMPYYGVFDWLEGGVLPDGTVTLRGEVTRPTTKSDAEYRVKRVEGVTKVVNELEVLPLSPSDDAIRIAMYRAMFNFDKPLFRYATRAVPPIHIIVKNGHVALKGFVASAMDKQIAYTAARNVSGVFEVTNELMVDKENY